MIKVNQAGLPTFFMLCERVHHVDSRGFPLPPFDVEFVYEDNDTRVALRLIEVQVSMGDSAPTWHMYAKGTENEKLYRLNLGGITEIKV